MVNRVLPHWCDVSSEFGLEGALSPGSLCRHCVEEPKHSAGQHTGCETQQWAKHVEDTTVPSNLAEPVLS